MVEVTRKHIQIDSVITATYAAKLIVLVVPKCRTKSIKSSYREIIRIISI
jgi:hypothetical protein